MTTDDLLSKQHWVWQFVRATCVTGQGYKAKNDKDLPEDLPSNLAYTDEGIPENKQTLDYWKLGETKHALDYEVLGKESGIVLDKMYDIIEANAPGRWLVFKKRDKESGELVNERVENVSIKIRRRLKT